MKKLLLLSFVFLTSGVLQTIAANKINWLSWEEAIEANRKSPKMIFVDVYTSWCGWCKRMDAGAFLDSAVVEYMNKHFYAVKFDAEQKPDVTYNNNVFKFNPTYKSHELAVSLLDGSMSYPSFVILNGKEQRMKILKGYMEPAILLANLKALKESQK